MVYIKYMTLQGLLVWILIRWNKELKICAWLHFVCVCVRIFMCVCVCACVPTCVRESGWNVLLADQLFCQLSSGGSPGLCTGYIQQETIFILTPWIFRLSLIQNTRENGTRENFYMCLSYMQASPRGLEWTLIILVKPCSVDQCKKTTENQQQTKPNTHTHTHTPGQHHIQRVKVGYPGQTAMRAGLA